MSCDARETSWLGFYVVYKERKEVTLSVMVAAITVKSLNASLANESTAVVYSIITAH